MPDKIIETPFTSGEPVNLKAASIICGKLEQYAKIEWIIDDYKSQSRRNVFTMAKYFRRILEVFEEV